MPAAPPPEPSQSPSSLALPLLSTLHGVLGRREAGRSLLRILRVQALARRWLYSTVLEEQRRRPDDITVVIGVRNRSDHRISLALRSIREQTHPAGQIQILVVDYGSEPATAAFIAAICREHGAAHVHVETTEPWSRSRCLNIGIRRVDTTFLMTSDVDILLSPGYISAALRILRESPHSVICSPMLDLPQHSAEVLRHAADTGGPLLLDEWRRWTKARLDWRSHPSITVTYSAFHHLVRGYDEYFELWGSEDLDLLRRLLKLGLDRHILDSDDAFYLHQWHPRYENMPADGLKRAIRRNADYRVSVHTILRNTAMWGRGGASPEPAD